MKNAEPIVAVIMGSDSDYPVMKKSCEVLNDFDVPFEMVVTSAHRTTDHALNFAQEADQRGIKVLIAGAGAAAHLPGVLAAKTTLPVIGVPINATALQGVDALHAIVQMPSGVPVATVAIDGAKNAALLAIQMLALSDESLKEKLIEYKKDMQKAVEKKNLKLQEQLAKDFKHD